MARPTSMRKDKYISMSVYLGRERDAKITQTTRLRNGNAKEEQYT